MAVAKMTAKGQVTVPKEIREALGLGPGDRLVFTPGEGSATISKERSLADLEGSLPPPAELRGLGWEEIRRRTRAAWALASEERGRGRG